MMYPFLTLNNDTEIVHSEMKSDGRVKVYIETPDLRDGFHNATCWLPDYTWENICGYSDTEMEYFKKLIKDNAHLILEFSQEGGILSASNFSFISGQTKTNHLNPFTFTLQKAVLPKMPQKYG